jgi:DNA mismatch repair protein MutS
MNASGKSSLMKATGVAVILAQCGCYVPAARLRISPFRSIFTRILSTDNLWAGLSSFAVEMTELAEALRRADPWSLVLGDEVCSGTESMSAMALVGGALEWLQLHGSRFIFATHLHGLQQVATVTALKGLKVWHLRVRHDPATDRLIYDRTLHPGAGSSLYGLEVARAMGIPFEVLQSAHQIRRSLAGEKTEAEATTSAWNTAVQRRACEIC